MNVKARRTKKQVNVENQAINLLSKEELNKKIAEKTKKDNAAKKTAADENQTGGEEKTDGE